MLSKAWRVDERDRKHKRNRDDKVITTNEMINKHINAEEMKINPMLHQTVIRSRLNIYLIKKLDAILIS